MNVSQNNLSTEVGGARQRYEALVALLEKPDLPCLPARRWSSRFPGDPVRRDYLKRDFARAYAAHRIQDYWNQDAEIVNVRRLVATAE